MDKQIYAGEWKIMECLWRSSPRTLMQIVHAMADEVGWAKSTVVTMVSRMEAKGLLRYEAGGKAKLIYPAVGRDEATQAEAKGLINKAFGGSAGLLMASLLQSQSLSREEIDELYALLKKAEEEGHA